MLCVTGAEKTAEALRARLERHADAPLMEVRLDLLEEELRREHLPDDATRLILTCRTRTQGGNYKGTEAERIAALTHVVRAVQPGWVDIEADVEAQTLRELIFHARGVGTKVLLSQHVFESGAAARVEDTLASMFAQQADAYKLAIQIDDAAELSALHAAGRATDKPVVLIGMGPAGLLSRALYPHFGSAWTYVAATAQTATAPGQLSLAQARDWGVPAPADADLFVLLGGAQIFGSPGPHVYNALFRERGINACYLPVLTSRLRETLGLLVLLGLRGASVTMPLKLQATAFADTLSKEVKASGATNTLTIADHRVHAHLTDGEGAVAALERHTGPVADKRAVLLGAGATTSAIAASLVDHGAHVTILARDSNKAALLAHPLGVRCGTLWDLGATPFDILVQTTPVGANDATATLVDDPTLLAGKTVLDVVLADTKLLADTRAAGGVAIGGRSMWAEQGRLQLQAWLGIDICAEQLERDP